MCRLLGYVARRPTSVVDALGEEEFEEFTALTAVHGDGWGMAWQDPDDDTVHSVSSPDSAVRDATYARRAREPLGRAGLVHLRWATRASRSPRRTPTRSSTVATRSRTTATSRPWRGSRRC